MDNAPKILFEDEDILVLEKAAGWVVNEIISAKNSPCVQVWLRNNFEYPVSKLDDYRSGIVHRLDKETSGLLIVAKTKEAFGKLQEDFKKRNIKKIYLALVHGSLEPLEGEISVPVGRLPWRRDRFGVFPGGRASKSFYKTLRIYSKDNLSYSLVEIRPITGRTHQIRIHLKYLGFPLVSDPFYLGRKILKKDILWCPRLFLHASQISFKHPIINKDISFTSVLPKDLEKVLKKLKIVRKIKKINKKGKES